MKRFLISLALFAASPVLAQPVNFPGILPDANHGIPPIAPPGFPGASTTGQMTLSLDGVTIHTLSSLLGSAGNVAISNPTGVLLLQQFGNSTHLQGTTDPTDLLIGIGAGANLPAVDDLATYVGWHAGNQMTNTNSESTGVGFNTQGAVTTGGYNTTLGVNTLGTVCTTCGHDIAIGTDSMRNAAGNVEIGIGDDTFLNEGSGASDNIAIGEQTYESNSSSTGVFNIAIGVTTFQGASLTNGSKNVVIGSGGVANGCTTCASNVLIGHQVGLNITNGGNNVLVGYQSGETLAGNGANTFVGSLTGQNVTTAAQNTLLGEAAGRTTFATGSGVILIASGKNTVDTPASSTSNYINIENILKVTGTNTPATSVSQFAGAVQLTAVATASLPACSATYTDSFAAVTDATSPTYNGTLTGGGAVHVPVYCNGTAWVTH